MSCCSAAGDYLPRLILYKSVHLYTKWCQEGPTDATYNTSENGWINKAIFFDWFQNCFIPKTAQGNKTRLLILDGHSSHVSLRIVETALANNIILLCLPAHSTHLLQPLDVAVFKPVKDAWRKILLEFYRSNRFSNVEKSVFPSLFKKLLESSFTKQHAVAGMIE